MRIFFEIIDQLLNNKAFEKLISIASGAVVSVVTYEKSSFGDFAIKCFAAGTFAIIGGFMGYAGKKFAEILFNYYKKRRTNKNEKNIKNS